MQASPLRDLTVGGFVLAGLASLAWLSLQVGGLNYEGRGGLRLIATFDEVGGLKPRAPVSISGVTVGQVKSIALDAALRARVELDVDSTLQLPVDTSAAILTEGLLGDQFVSLAPGAEEEVLNSGEELQFTESALSIERLIGKFVNNAGLGDGEENQSDSEEKSEL
jgi:phospholipid/cholesterol/gamma-HCH transport system substrate-binding protein